MNTKTTVQSFVARALIVTITVMVTPHAEGAMIGSERAIGGDRERILTLLERPEVAAQLEAYGVSMTDATARVAALTDAEAAQLSKEIDEAYAGGDGFTAVIGTVFVAFALVAAVAFVVIAAPFVLAGKVLVAALRGRASPHEQAKDAVPHG